MVRQLGGDLSAELVDTDRELPDADGVLALYGLGGVVADVKVDTRADKPTLVSARIY